MSVRHFHLIDLLKPVYDLISSNWWLIVACSSLVVLFSWRFWRFSLRPLLKPQEPKEYPYWIPYIGHLFSFLRNSEALLATAGEYFGEGDHIFTITLAGLKAHIVKDPRLVGLVFNNTTSLSFDSFLHDIMSEFGTTESGIQSILEVPQHDIKGGAKPKSVSQMAHDLQVRQTHGDELHLLGASIIESFQELLSVNAVSLVSNGVRLEKSNFATSGQAVWLKTWTADCFIKAGQQAYFGNMLAAIDPTLPSALMEMDSLSWQIFYRYPKICRLRLQKLCDQILAALRRYLAVPVLDRQAPAWFTLKLEQQYRKAGLNDEDIATQLLFLYWGINTNISKVGFWIVVHLLKHPDLVVQIRREIAVAFDDANDIVDSNHIYKDCPLLHAIWLEALRVSAASTALRGITQDFVLGDKVLRAGDQVLVSARQLHLRDQEFGENVYDFDHRRFLQHPALERSPAFRPFGGGPTMCPGRQLAKHMTLNFIALLYRRYEVTLDPSPQQFPRYEEGKPSIGIMSGEGDLKIRLEPRYQPRDITVAV